MTNEEAIKTLKANYPDACFEQLREAVEMAINALQAQESCNQLATNLQPSKQDATDPFRQAVTYLDFFTKVYCRDKSVEDDLVFRCKQCEFEMDDGKCLVKVMARQLCPDYKDFGSMGDL